MEILGRVEIGVWSYGKLLFVALGFAEAGSFTQVNPRRIKTAINTGKAVEGYTFDYMLE